MCVLMLVCVCVSVCVLRQAQEIARCHIKPDTFYFLPALARYYHALNKKRSQEGRRARVKDCVTRFNKRKQHGGGKHYYLQLCLGGEVTSNSAASLFPFS